MRNVTLPSKYLPELIAMTANAKTDAGRSLHQWLLKEQARRINSGKAGGRPRKHAA